MDDALPPMLAKLAAVVARNASRSGIFERADLEQEALIVGWLWLREHGYGLGYDDELKAILYVTMSRRVIDYMRQANPLHMSRRREPGGTRRFLRPPPVSLDAPLASEYASDNPLTVGDLILDSSSAHEFQAIETREDVTHAFHAHSDLGGPQRHAEVAWLYLKGHTFAEIAAAYGVTESRACQMRKAFITTVARGWVEPAGEPVAA